MSEQSWTAFQLLHHLVEEKHSDDQEAQSPPIGACEESDTQLLMNLFNVESGPLKSSRN